MMSLKSLHLIYAVFGALSACGVGAWWTASALSGGGGVLTWGIGAFLLGVGLIVYGVGFYARSGELPWL